MCNCGTRHKNVIRDHLGFGEKYLHSSSVVPQSSITELACAKKEAASPYALRPRDFLSSRNETLFAAPVQQAVGPIGLFDWQRMRS